MTTPLRLAWAVDLHLVFLTPSPNFPEDDLTPFLEKIAKRSFDALVISGDISEAHMLKEHLGQLETYIQRPIYFVLGNHDFYWSSLEHVSSEVQAMTAESNLLRCLEFSGLVRLTEKTGMIGHGCWGDGRLGDLFGSSTILNDWRVIENLNRCTNGPTVPPEAAVNHNVRKRFLEQLISDEDVDLESLKQELQRLGQIGADHIARLLPEALDECEHVILVTHAPPFLPDNPPPRKIWDEWAPHAGCKAAADTILDIMDAYPHRQLTILSGHVHREYRKAVKPNIEQRTAFAEYGEPCIREVLLVE